MFRKLSSLILPLVIAGLLVAGVLSSLSGAQATLASQPEAPNLISVPLTVTKGIALLDWAHKEDLTTTAVSQYYGWGEYCQGAPNCLNMNRNWTLPQNTCYPMMLLGNEPTNDEPAGHLTTPQWAAYVTVKIHEACPSMKLIVANIHLNNPGAGVDEAYDWLHEYLVQYTEGQGQEVFTHTIGVHCYSSSSATCLDRMRRLDDLDFSGKFWLTEFSLFGSVELDKFLKGLLPAQPRIERTYLWTNRCQGPSMDIVVGDCSLTPYVEFGNGSLTAIGTVYKNWVPPTLLYQSVFPMVGRRPAGYP